MFLRYLLWTFLSYFKFSWIIEECFSAMKNWLIGIIGLHQWIETQTLCEQFSVTTEIINNNLSEFEINVWISLWNNKIMFNFFLLQLSYQYCWLVAKIFLEDYTDLSNQSWTAKTFKQFYHKGYNYLLIFLCNIQRQNSSQSKPHMS